jgi:hypothetical protein
MYFAYNIPKADAFKTHRQLHIKSILFPPMHVIGVRAAASDSSSHFDLIAPRRACDPGAPKRRLPTANVAFSRFGTPVEHRQVIVLSGAALID